MKPSHRPRHKVELWETDICPPITKLCVSLTMHSFLFWESFKWVLNVVMCFNYLKAWIGLEFRHSVICRQGLSSWRLCRLKKNLKSVKKIWKRNIVSLNLIVTFDGIINKFTTPHTVSLNANPFTSFLRIFDYKKACHIPWISISTILSSISFW